MNHKVQVYKKEGENTAHISIIVTIGGCLGFSPGKNSKHINFNRI